MPSSAASDTRSRTLRSAITNGSKLARGLDGRSASARRYRDLQIALADDLGGAASLNEADRVLISQAAASVVAAEHLQAAILRGEAVDTEQLSRLGNAARQALTRLKAKARPVKLPSPLAQHFSNPPTREVRR